MYDFIFDIRNYKKNELKIYHNKLCQGKYNPEPPRNLFKPLYPSSTCSVITHLHTYIHML